MSCPQQDGYSHHHRRKSLYLHHFKNAFRQTNAYHVQLIPQVPKYADAEVCRDHIGAEVIVQNGPYKSKWLRVMWVNCSGNSDCIDDILAELEDIEKNATGAVYITIPNRAITQSTPDGIGRLLQAIVGRGMTFYTQSSHQDLIWYKWCNPDVPNLVPTYATSIEGAGVLMLSPDETEVLLVLEWGSWGRIGGAVDPGESCFDAAVRECKEETGLDVDFSFPIKVGAVYNQPKARDGIINDHFVLFVARALTKSLGVQDGEVDATCWFSIDVLLSRWKKHIDSSNTGAHSDTLQTGTVRLQDTPITGRFGTMELAALARYREGSCQEMQKIQGKYPAVGYLFH
eukprot:m.140346 g.140346  ORF g.140346 m.140346 type:complete len:343 (+) comp17660_c0_seq4:170-1198(+)